MAGDYSVDVGQFDLDGNSKLNMTFNFKFHVYSVAFLNIADGGFILIVGGNVDGDNKEHLKMLKISGDQRIIRSLNADACAVGINDKITLQLFQNEANKYCVAFLRSNVRRYNTGFNRGKQFAELMVKCYTDDEFIVDNTLSL